MSRSEQPLVERIWSERGVASNLLLPLAWAYRIVSERRRHRALASNNDGIERRVPVVVVGNLTAGGTGKTPLVAALVPFFSERGWRCGIVSRGYGGKRQKRPVLVSVGDSARRVGDEPLMLARSTGVPVCVCIDRTAAVDWLASLGDVDLVIADDGLQHHALVRDVEICVVDAERGFGNGRLLPAGPLREGPERLDSVDVVAVRESATGASRAATPRIENFIDCGSFTVELAEAVRLGRGDIVDLASMRGTTVHAIAGIGRPARFFDALRAFDLELIEHPYPDHHAFRAADLHFDDGAPVLVTSKDAVKIAPLVLATQNIVEIRTRVRFSPALESALERVSARLDRIYRCDVDDALLARRTLAGNFS